MATVQTAKPSRTASRELRRQQLIDATMKCIGRKGLAGTTLSDVAREAGLSQGIVNLHFESKDNLLTETLLSLANEYKTQFDKALRRSGPRPADQLLALMEHDLRPSICDRSKLAVWFAFWGEVRSRPTYRKICDEYDCYYDDAITELCDAVIEEGGYDGDGSRCVGGADVDDERPVVIVPDQSANLGPAVRDGCCEQLPPQRIPETLQLKEARRGHSTQRRREKVATNST